ncbi:MAG: type VI secretion system contractile sheath large subunit [Candidatus Competibacter sp.]|nr:type VI secretion system contractile sheath large subunit [Candidatus Competibacter sp.]MDG4606900.1 type VI secretion system contractile sheath large subunit [Candidatus Contendobacter sp.]HRD48341.1 type VI secretion system contractile sheath large subunit [Candidatus Contendobacter sp.]
MPGRMEFQLTLPQSAPLLTRREAGAPLRILIMADFSGRNHREASADLPDLDNRPLLPVDVDHFDTVMARFSPKVSLPLGVNGAALTISFGQLDDFHPDALYQRLELFQALRGSRARLLNPASFDQAVAELSPASPRSLSQAQSGPTVAPEGEADLFERLLGQPPVATPLRRRLTDPGAAAIQSLLQMVVQPHIERTDPRQPAWVAAVDAAIGEQMRAILRQPAFQALEATWRGAHSLIAHLDSDAVQVFLLDVTRSELLLDLRAADGHLQATSLYLRLIDRGVHAHSGEPWSLLVGDYGFGAGAEDIALLAALGSLAAHAGGPFLAAAEPGALGCAAVAQLADPAQWAALPADAEQNWRRLRTSAVAPWIGLALPQILLRMPYGQKTDPIEAFAFEEMPAGRDPEAYLWGNPAFACARLIVDAFTENDRAFRPGDVLDIVDLPMHIYEEAGERVMQPATEALLGERAMNAILARGIMPLLGQRQRNAARLVRFQSLADPPVALAGAWR